MGPRPAAKALGSRDHGGAASRVGGSGRRHGAKGDAERGRVCVGWQGDGRRGAGAAPRREAGDRGDGGGDWAVRDRARGGDASGR